MINYELKACIMKNGDRQESLAKAIGMHPSRLSAKINGKAAFKQPEIESIAIRYKLTADDIQRIFFTQTVKR